MKKSLLKNNFKSIHRTRRRFISILIMAFLGVGFYSGLVASSPDMLDSLDKYADSSNLYDINIISTLGLTDDDINAVKQIDGIENAYGTQTKDSLSKIDDKENICKVIEFNENINVPVITSGRNIQNENECLLDSAIIRTGSGAEDYIGKKIILENEDKDSDDNPIFTVKEFEIVGIVESPIYISGERGNTSIGNGTVSFYIFTQDNVINMDYYTGLYATVKGAKGTVTNSDEYLNLVNPVLDKLDNIKQERENSRYNQLVDDATNKVTDAQKEFDDKKRDVEKELKDAKDKLDKAESKINSSEKKLLKAEKEVKKQENTANNKFKELSNQLKSAEKELSKQYDQLEIAKKTTPEIPEYQTKLVLWEKELNSKKEEISNQKAQLEKSKKDSLSKIKKAKAEIKENKNKLNKSRKTLAEKKKDYEAGKKKADKKLQNAQSKLDDAKEEIKKIEKCKWYIQDRLDNTGYNNIFDAIKTMSNISKLFPIIFYLVAVLISLTSMTRMIEEERIEIGTLKALGYTNMQIMSKYLIYSILACTIGGFLGMTIGLYLIPNIVWILYGMIYKISHFYCTYRVDIGIIGIIISFVCIGGATIFVANQELKEMPSVLMRPKPPKKGKKILLEKIPFIWKKFNFSHKVIARNIFRYKKRAIMTIVGIAGCTGLMLAGFGIKDSIMDIPTDQFEKIFKYDVSVSLSNTDGLDNLENYLKSNDNVNNYVKICATTGELKNDTKNFNTTVFVPNSLDNYTNVYNLMNYQTNESVTLNDDGIIITDKAADMLDVTYGDYITFIDSNDVEYRFKVENIAKNHVGHCIYMSKNFYEKNIKSYKTNMVYINYNDITTDLENRISEDILNMDGVASVSVISALMKTVSDMLNTMNYVVVILIVSSALLAFVVLYNLANINIAERQREIATLKVLGFHDNEVDNYINKENIIFTFVGIALGLVFGTFLTSGIIASIEIDSLRFMKNIRLLSYVYSSAITLLFSFIVNFIIHFILKKIDMIESLKSVE